MKLTKIIKKDMIVFIFSFNQTNSSTEENDSCSWVAEPKLE